MIKWPEPAGYIRKDQLQKVQQGWTCLCDVGPEPRADKQPIHTEAQLKQAVRDALERAFQVAGPEDSYQDEHFKAKADSAMRIRKLIEEI